MDFCLLTLGGFPGGHTRGKVHLHPEFRRSPWGPRRGDTFGEHHSPRTMPPPRGRGVCFTSFLKLIFKNNSKKVQEEGQKTPKKSKLKRTNKQKKKQCKKRREGRQQILGKLPSFVLEGSASSAGSWVTVEQEPQRDEAQSWTSKLTSPAAEASLAERGGAVRGSKAGKRSCTPIQTALLP